MRPIRREPWCVPAWHLYVVLVDFQAVGITRDAVMQRLSVQGIGTQVHYIPVYRQPYYQSLNAPACLPGAERYYECTLSIPLFPTMTDDDVLRVVRALAEALSL